MQEFKQKYKELTGKAVVDGGIISLDNIKDRGIISELRKYLSERLGKEDIQNQGSNGLETIIDVRRKNGHLDEILMESYGGKTFFYTKEEDGKIDVEEVYEHITKSTDFQKKLNDAGKHYSPKSQESKKAYNMDDYRLDKIYHSNGDLILKLKVENQKSLHMRPASLIDRKVNEYGKEVEMTWNGEDFVQARVLGIMLSHAQEKKKKDEVLIKIQGNDIGADRVALEIYDLFKNKFYED